MVSFVRRFPSCRRKGGQSGIIPSRKWVGVTYSYSFHKTSVPVLRTLQSSRSPPRPLLLLLPSSILFDPPLSFLIQRALTGARHSAHLSVHAALWTLHAIVRVPTIFSLLPSVFLSHLPPLAITPSRQHSSLSTLVRTRDQLWTISPWGRDTHCGPRDVFTISRLLVAFCLTLFHHLVLRPSSRWTLHHLVLRPNSRWTLDHLSL